MRWVKYALLALAPIVLGFGVWWTFFRQSVPLASSIPFVNVRTGEVVWMPREKIVSIPERTRDGAFLLYPLTKDSHGSFVVSERFRDGLKELAREGPLRVDLQTYRITAGP